MRRACGWRTCRSAEPGSHTELRVETRASEFDRGDLGNRDAPPVNVNQATIGMLNCPDFGCPVRFFAAVQTTTYAGPAPAQIAGVTQINFNLGVSPPPSFTVAAAVTAAAPSGVYSNAFQIYVAGQ